MFGVDIGDGVGGEVGCFPALPVFYQREKSSDGNARKMFVSYIHTEIP